jgi:phage tail sheath protein FI
MVELTFKSPGVSANEIDLSGPSQTGPIGTPAGIIGTSTRGPAFVPLTVGTLQNYNSKFGPSDGEKYGPLAASEWLNNSTALTYLKVLGVGKGEKRLTTGNNIGSVESAGFVVGEQQPLDTGNFGDNPYAVSEGEPGRTYFLGCYMSESAGSDIFSSAQIQDGTSAHPIIRGVLLAASGVIPLLSSTLAVDSSAPSATDPATAGAGTLKGDLTGSVQLLNGSTAKQEFVLLLNGHKGTDSSYPNVVTASFDPTAPNYFANLLNKDPFSMQKAGYLLYTHYDIHPALAAVTGTGLLLDGFASGQYASLQDIAFITTGSEARNTGSPTVPNYENFEDRFSAAISPYVISQKFGGSPKNLFRLHGLSDGAGDSESYKFSIENISPSQSEEDQFGTFDLLVRDISDNDDNKVVLESYRGLSLNPSSDRFIGKAIGDEYRYFDFDRANGTQKLVVDGNYPNVSGRVRVEITDEVFNGDVEPTALPAGFRGKYHLVTSGSAPLTTVSSSVAVSADILQRSVEPPTPFRKNITIGVDPKKVINRNLYWGVQFEKNISTTEPNKSAEPEETVRSFAKYFPGFMTTNQNIQVGNNEGTAFSSANGNLDADVFNNNIFSLENIQVVTGSDGKANLKTVDEWTYVREGNITDDISNKTRALDLSTDLSILGVRSLTKFSFFMQGGFDGVNIFDKDENDLTNRAIIEEMNFTARGQDEGPTVRAYRKALDIMGETSEVDVNILAIPGIRHSVVTDQALITAQSRFDAIYIMDIEERDTVNSVITSSLQDVNVQNTVNSFAARAIDSSFGAAYFPDLVIKDPTTNTNVRVPPSVGVIGAYALNDAVGHPWLAPAGFTRGAMENVKQTAVTLNQGNLDDLYEVDINPITAFPGGPGVVVWGQKTLLAAQSALDRINVRRLLLELRRRVKRVANDFLFEPNREETLARFSARVNPILNKIQEQAGIDRYRVRIDTSTTTQADVENNTVRGVIYIQPTRTVEFVALDFVVTNNGVTI